MHFGSQSESATVRSILLKRPEEAYVSDEHIAKQWRQLNYLNRPDYGRALDEYQVFVDLIQRHVEEIHFLPQNDETGLDSVYVHDPVVITEKGAILCNMGKAERLNEPGAVGKYLEGIGIPVLGAITGDGKLEGGDIAWLDERTLAVGQGYRTNAEGIGQLRKLTEDLVDDFIVVPLPHWTGPGDCLHLMSNISPIDTDMVVVHSRLLTVPFREYLLKRGTDLIEVPDSEYESMACNVLAVAPRKVIMLSGNPLTRDALEKAGVEVVTYKGEHISRFGAGGPTCLTRPLLRQD